MGGLLASGIPVDLSIVSDDAGQFNVFDHALCWIHAERVINRLIPLNENQIQAVDRVRELAGHCIMIWNATNKSRILFLQKTSENVFKRYAPQKPAMPPSTKPWNEWVKTNTNS